MSILIVQQGWAITVNAFRQLTDASVSPSVRESLLEALQPLLPASTPNAAAVTASGASTAARSPIERDLLAIRNLRAMRAGALMFVDLVAEVPRTMSVTDASTLEAKIARTLKAARKEIAEVRVKFAPPGPGTESEPEKRA